MLVPQHRPSVTAIWGCISVGKPGYGRVFTCVCLSGLEATTRTASSDSVTSQPISDSFAEMDSRCFGITFFDRHIAVRRSGSKHKRAGFDLIRDDRIFRLMQSLYTTDPDHIRTCALDIGSPCCLKKFARSTT